MELGLKGKRVIIPASTKGILRRVVDQLIDEGCDVAICSRSEDTLHGHYVNYLAAREVPSVELAM